MEALVPTHQRTNRHGMHYLSRDLHEHSAKTRIIWEKIKIQWRLWHEYPHVTQSHHQALQKCNIRNLRLKYRKTASLTRITSKTKVAWYKKMKKTTHLRRKIRNESRRASVAAGCIAAMDRSCCDVWTDKRISCPLGIPASSVFHDYEI